MPYWHKIEVGNKTKTARTLTSSITGKPLHVHHLYDNDTGLGTKKHMEKAGGSWLEEQVTYTVQ